MVSIQKPLETSVGHLVIQSIRAPPLVQHRDLRIKWKGLDWSDLQSTLPPKPSDVPATRLDVGDYQGPRTY